MKQNRVAANHGAVPSPGDSQQSCLAMPFPWGLRGVCQHSAMPCPHLDDHVEGSRTFKLFWSQEEGFE